MAGDQLRRDSSPLCPLLSMMVNNCGELFSLLPIHFLARDQLANELEVPR